MGPKHVEHLEDLVTILLVDDDEEDYLITRDIIEEIDHRKYTLDWISSYDQALALISQKLHHVYLIDFQLGARSGLELIKEAIAKGCDSPMILLTGYGDRDTDEQALQAGAADYMIKGSLNPDQLERSIRYTMQQARNLKQIRDLNIELEARVNLRTQDLAKANEELRQSQLLYRAIAHNYPNGVIAVFDANLHYVFADGKEMEKLGLNPDEMPGKSLQEIFPEEEALIMDAELRKVLKGEEVSFEIRFQEKDYLVRGVPLVQQDGKVVEVLSVGDNITEQKHAARNIEQALEKERQLSNLKSRFVSMASHEFRTPLSTIMSSVTLISRYEDPAYVEKRRRHIDRIKSSVRNLSNILNDFLSLGKLEEGKVECNPSQFMLSPFVETVVEEMRLNTKDGQEIIHEPDGTKTEVFLDRQLLKNILHNLLSNAIKYSPEGSEIQLRCSQNNGEIRLEVEDAGMGIPEEEQKHLFERFFRAHNATNIQGTGLGLSIVKEYVSLMDGKIEFSSKQNQGTIFTVTFPVKKQ